ncbi:hypothetical protein FH972_023875 [Carpinus fangiana]|uniref:Aminopeptidase P N-terminal domain-containing protein n=1 Tax=Carpinus fangiana TaxID=176857 RepID=A0A5N6KWT2_9ROSI|nr:hypothetical protein FH972_023875 [Carpinus fangiana]
MASMWQQMPPQTPQRHFPGVFPQTPGPGQQQQQQAPIPFNPFKPQNATPQSGVPTGQSQISYPNLSQVAPAQPEKVSLIERAAVTINASLDQENRYPALDSYISQGYSAEYDQVSSAAWAPFQKIKQHELPDKIFEQYENAQVSTMMGLFADINHAWVAIDNALYLWDFTHPNPELIGFEEQPNSITAVALVWPRKGVFVPAIKRLLVVATTVEIFLIGVSVEATQQGSTAVGLYQTHMQTSIKSTPVQCIAGSPATGRIFFGGKGDDDINELTYQQEEKWFANRCGKINHTRTSFGSIMPAMANFNRMGPDGYLKQIVVDDSRNVVYTLSSGSAIRVFHMKTANTLELSIIRKRDLIMNDLFHKVGQSALVGKDTSIVSISAISSQEASRLNLVATTSSGGRIYFSAVYGSIYSGDRTNAPTSMQVYHFKFPPADASQPQNPPPGPAGTQALAYPNALPTQVSNALTPSRTSTRFPPGYFLCFVQKEQADTLFLCAPDAARIAHPQDPSQVNRLHEFGSWVPLDSRMEDVGLISKSFAAASQPTGFGNELAVQFDLSVTEFAVLTATGVSTFRRRRLVDVFASAIQYGGGDEGIDGDVRSFIRMYGRGETVATALAVACGQGSEVSNDRVVRITDQEILDYARKTFIEQGGKPMLNENYVIDQGAPAIENVKPSPRAEGLAMYIARLLRSVWRAPIITQTSSPAGVSITSTVAQTKLQEISRDLTRLQEFLDKNKTFIEGLSGPEALGRVSTRQEEVALQGEHRALSSLLQLINDTIEGISFVLVLFDERVDEIVLLLPDSSKAAVKGMTYEKMFCTREGKDLAKELVKAIVNRNIAQGSNVDTVTDALRRKCGSFCSADDCVIFKAQEQLKRAADGTANSETSRGLLNEGLRLLSGVAKSLTHDQLMWAVDQFIAMSFYAGAIQLALTVAKESDRGNQALAWIHAGSPGGDERADLFAKRARCYELIYRVILAVDAAALVEPEIVDGIFTVTAKRTREAYDVINDSTDEVFHIALYDWYLGQGWSDRLLEMRSPHVINYLQRKSEEDAARADLLWRYYAKYNNFIEAAQVQFQLAKSPFPLSLDQRIEYLGYARANASTRTVGLTEMGRSRQSRQELIREISDLLDVANIQSDISNRMKGDERLSGPKRDEHLAIINGQILNIDELYNTYADNAGYFDLCLLIYQVADYRNSADIRATWQNLIQVTHDQAIESKAALPFEVVAEKKPNNKTETVLPMLEKYALEYQKNIGPPTWVVDIFLDLGVPHELIVYTLEGVWLAEEAPFAGANRKQISTDLLHAIKRWYADSAAQTGGFEGSMGGQPGALLFGGEENCVAISQLLADMVAARTGSLNSREREEAVALRIRIEQRYQHLPDRQQMVIKYRAMAAAAPKSGAALDAYISSNKYPAKAHLRKVAAYIRQHSDAAHPPDLDNSVIFLESSKSWLWPNSDQEAPVRQDRYFFYATGCELVDCCVVYDVGKDRSTLFVPPVVDADVIWSGLPVQREEALKRYVNFLLSVHTTDLTLLKEAIEESRVVKDDYEIALSRKANNVSAAAHLAVMRAAKTAKNERELAGIFVKECIAGGCTNQAYSPIVAAGTNGATLHYVHNNHPIDSSTLNILLDASGEYSLYASDITRTFPINGKFTKESRDIYSLVLSIQKECIKRLHAGLLWDSLQQLAHEMVVDGLLKLGIFKGDREDIIKAQTSTAFFPHGLGHYLGMDTHDTGGHPNYSDPEAIFKYLRVRGELPANSIITVEPGVYFCRFIIEPYLKDDKHKAFIDEKVLDRYWQVGGVRIEDDVLVLDGGSESLTTVPKELEDIEAVVTGA